MSSKFPPYKHQVTGKQLYVENDVFADFSDMGTGKSRTLVDGACELRYRKMIDAVLIVCPNSVKDNWSDARDGQIIQYGRNDLRHVIYTLSSGKKLYPVDGLDPLDFKWVLVNYESVWRPKMSAWLIAFMKLYRTAMVLDESHRIKTPNASQTKGCIRLGRYAKRRYLISGTPVTKNPLDYWSQFKFLDPDITGHPYFSTYRLEFAEMIPQTIGGNTFNKVTGFKNLDTLLARVGPYYRRVEKKDCLDLLPKTYVKREIELNAEQSKAYKQMADHFVATVAGAKIQAPIALTKILKLLQITSGYLTQDGEVYRLGESPKIKEMLNLLDEHDGQSVVFFKEHAERELIEEAFQKAGISYASIHGEIKTTQRNEFKRDFQKTSKYQTMLAQVATGGIGIDLTAAEIAIYMGNSHAWEHRVQSEDRLHRSGQLKAVTYYDLLATIKGIQTFDHVVVRSLLLKEDLQAKVVKNEHDLANFFKGKGIE